MTMDWISVKDRMPEDVCQLNVDKLRRRYPDGFDPERSMHREEGDI